MGRSQGEGLNRLTLVAPFPIPDFQGSMLGIGRERLERALQPRAASRVGDLFSSLVAAPTSLRSKREPVSTVLS